MGLLCAVGCSQFSTSPPYVPSIIEVTDERFEFDFVLMLGGQPELVLRNDSAYDNRIELWFYPEQEAVVVMTIWDGHVRANTYHYSETR